jgi:hypothetical protein
MSADLEPAARESDVEQGVDHVASVAILIGVLAAVIAGATIWLVFTDPVTVATSLDEGAITPLVKQLADVILDALFALLEYL